MRKARNLYSNPSFLSLPLFFFLCSSPSPPSSQPFPTKSHRTGADNASIWCFHWAMTDGMVTRARAMEEQLTSMADQLARHDSVLAKLDSLCSTVQQHSESFEAIRKSNSESFNLLWTLMASQQAVMAEMMNKLQYLDRSSNSSSSQPPLLPLPASPPLPLFQTHTPLTPSPFHSHNSISIPRLPKIEVPLFSGEHVLSWLFQINHFDLSLPPDTGWSTSFDCCLLLDWSGTSMVSMVAFDFSIVSLGWFCSEIGVEIWTILLYQSWCCSLQAQANIHRLCILVRIRMFIHPCHRVERAETP